MATTTWSIDPTHSEIGFKIKHLMISNVSGSFTAFEAKAQTTGNDFTTATIEAKIKADSIQTNNEQRDAHLRNADFFEVDQHPEIIFTSTRIEKANEEKFTVYGNLTIKGVTKPVQLTAEFNGLTKDPWGGERAGFVVTGKINRTQWGLSFNALMETGGLVLGEEVKIYSEVQLVKQAAVVAEEAVA